MDSLKKFSLFSLFFFFALKWREKKDLSGFFSVRLVQKDSKGPVIGSARKLYAQIKNHVFVSIVNTLGIHKKSSHYSWVSTSDRMTHLMVNKCEHGSMAEKEIVRQ